MNMIAFVRLTVAVWLLPSLTGNAAASTPSHWSVGFRQIEHGGVEIGVWYPSTSPVGRLRHGPFDVEYADHGTPALGRFPVVLMSHGLAGRSRNHHLTASGLVKRGYVVLAPQHSHDRLIWDNKIIRAMEHRLNDLAVSLAGLGDDPQLNEIADQSRIHGLGYSLGSATIFVASGQAKIDLDRLEGHCA